MSQLKRIYQAMLASVILFVVGCASTPPITLAEMQADQARKLAVRCYWEHEGERWVVGRGEVFAACNQWANKVVRVRYDQSSTSHSAAFSAGHE